MSKIGKIPPRVVNDKIANQSAAKMNLGSKPVLIAVNKQVTKKPIRSIIDLSTEELGFFKVGNRIVDIKFPR